MDKKIYKKKYKEKLIQLLKSYLENNEDQEMNEETKPILIPITRVGYWLFRTLYNYTDESENFKNDIFNRFEIYSDRYLTKVINEQEFENRKVILFDNMLATGDNIFYHFTYLKKWKADVEIITLARELGTEKGKNNKKKAFFEQIYGNGQDKYFEKLLVKFEEAQRTYCKGSDWVTPEDAAKLSIIETAVLEDELCPMTIDSPIICKNSTEKIVTLSQDEWDKIKECSKWKYVENLSKETVGVEINASFFEATECVQQLACWGEVEDCIIKCKYRQMKGKEEIEVIFVPVVIMKSMSYFETVELFFHLYNDTEYGREIIGEQKNGEVSVIDTVFKNIRENFNLYRTLYRAVSFYFSTYIGKRFIEFLTEETSVKKLDFDWNFMKHHLPENMIGTVKSLMTDDIYGEMYKKLSITYVNETDLRKSAWENIQITDDEWKQIYYQIKQKLIDIKFRKEQNENMITIEAMEAEISNQIPEIGRSERRIAIARIITLLQETNCVSNYIINNKDTAIVERGFMPGENAIKLLGEEIEVFLPYIYAFYLKVGEDEFYKNYGAFITRMRTYFYNKKYFEYKINPAAFTFYVRYFSDDSETGWSIKQKLSQVRYVIEGYLDGDNNDYETIFDLVYEWEL